MIQAHLCVCDLESVTGVTLMEPCYCKKHGSFSFLFILMGRLMNFKCGKRQSLGRQKGIETSGDVWMSRDDTNQN